MTQPLRAWHRRIVFGLAVLLPLLFAAGLAARRPVRRAVEAPAPTAPDVLVYWSPSKPGGKALPRGALLGRQAQGGYVIFYSLAHQEIVRWEANP
jgi:hypothetical protein